jgi:hypothetical protein
MHARYSAFASRSTNSPDEITGVHRRHLGGLGTQLAGWTMEQTVIRGSIRMINGEPYRPVNPSLPFIQGDRCEGVPFAGVGVGVESESETRPNAIRLLGMRDGGDGRRIRRQFCVLEKVARQQLMAGPVVRDFRRRRRRLLPCLSARLRRGSERRGSGNDAQGCGERGSEAGAAKQGGAAGAKRKRR